MGQLVRSLVPAQKAKPLDALQSDAVGKPMADQIKRWIEVQRDRPFPHVKSLVRDILLVMSIKAVTDETLNDTKF